MISVRNRQMIIPIEERVMGVEGDTNVSLKVFSIPRYNPNDIDLSGLAFTLEMKYITGATNTSAFENKIVNEKDIQLTWLVRDTDVQVPGTVLVNIKATDVSGVTKWRSFPGVFYVPEAWSVAENYTGDLTIYEAILARCILIEDAEVQRQAAEEQRELAKDEMVRATDAANTAAQNYEAATLENTDVAVVDLRNRLKEFSINVKDYGAIGDGVTDDTKAFKDAIAVIIAEQKGGGLFIPTGTYIISDTLNITYGIKIHGIDSMLGASSIIQMTGNKPLFYVTSQCTFEGLVLKGSNDPTFTLQDGIFIDNTNGVAVKNVNFFAFYNDVHLKDTVFYSYFSDCIWYSCIHAMIFGEGTSYAGYALEINDCQVVSSQGQYGFRFQNIGSLLIDNLMMGPQNLTVAGICFESMAQGAGVTNVSNSAIEISPRAIELIGTPSNPVKFIMFSNCYFGGDYSVYMKYASGINFSNCYLTGNHTLYGEGELRAIKMVSCMYQTVNVPITATATTSWVDLELIAPSYVGGFNFIYLPHIPPASIKKISIIGGEIGSNSDPVAVHYQAINNVMIDGVKDYNLSPIKTKRLTGKCDASGVVLIDFASTDELYGVSSKLVNVFAVCNNGSYSAIPLVLSYVTPSQIRFTGGTANMPYQIIVQYTTQDDANWYTI